ncbi:tetratricopeptide repeat protein [Helicobacter suis]|uniref:tetratricopeptide repeat protein n=1 Tax=Helicobacter suis TaxID=104628 RepID=UPI001F082F18|nr:hypothetical protein [Helicobacter suis]
MAISNAVQRGSRVYAYDENGDELFNKPGALVRFTDDAVFVRRGARVCKLDIYGYVVDPDVKESEGGSGGGLFLGLLVIGLLIQSGVSYVYHHVHDYFFPPPPPSFKDQNKREQVFHDAMGLFRQQSYKKAQERFIWLAQIKYRPAFSYYMAGQCAYKTQHYQEAIQFYKQSLAIKEQASYTPILLENTANAYKALKDHKNYEHTLHLLAHYPQSEEGKKALAILQQK